MRASTAFGGFLLTAGLITFILRPVYNAGPLPQGAGVESTGPLQDIRPVPTSVAALSVGAGLLLLFYSWTRRNKAG
jgi:hypothetical protein